MTQAKARFRALLGVEPYSDAPYYVGFKVADQDIGLVPNNPEGGMTAFYDVADIQQSLQSLLDAGSQTLRQVRDVGGGRLVASVRDADGNIIGLVQDA
jgi:predicted enzyme related to lactoylglutathione lyase